jgi:hypothetical protein
LVEAEPLCPAIGGVVSGRRLAASVRQGSLSWAADR